MEILQNREVAFPRLTRMNDPYEGQISWIPSEDEKKEAEKDDFQVERIQYKVHIEKTINQFGVLCLSEKLDNMLMWSHYASNHQGFLIGFDSEHDFFNTTEKEIDYDWRLTETLNTPGFGTMNPIDYRHQLLKIPTNGNYSLYDVFFAKSYHWEYEKEYRIVKNVLKVTSNYSFEERGEIMFFGFPPDAIKEIVIGLNASKKDFEVIIELAKSEFKHVRLGRIELDYDNYQLKVIWL